MQLAKSFVFLFFRFFFNVSKKVSMVLARMTNQHSASRVIPTVACCKKLRNDGEEVWLEHALFRIGFLNGETRIQDGKGVV